MTPQQEKGRPPVWADCAIIEKPPAVASFFSSAVVFFGVRLGFPSICLGLSRELDWSRGGAAVFVALCPVPIRECCPMIRCPAVMFVFALALAVASAESAFAQFGSPPWAGTTLRGRYHYYHGPHVSFGRGRWGGGLSPYGASVLNNVISTAGAVAPSLVPIFVPGAGVGVRPPMTQPGPDDDSVEAVIGTPQIEAAPIDPNRERRDRKLADMESRSRNLLKAFGLEDDEAPLADASDAKVSSDSTTEPFVTEGTLPPPR